MPHKIRISNLKVSIKVQVVPDLLIQFKNEHQQECKDSGSFFVYRQKSFVYCIYYNGHVNLTGVHCVTHIRSAVHILGQVPGIQAVIGLTVDNITCTAKLHPSIYEWKKSFAEYLQDIARFECFTKIQYSPQTFPGAFLKTQAQGTIIFFATGKFNIVGCKTSHDLLLLLTKFTQVVRTLASEETNGAVP